MRLAASRDLYAYWRTLKGARAAPERNDVDPGAIRGILADTFILDFLPEGGFPFRISGTRTNALFCRELRGMPFLDLWRKADRAETQEILLAVADDVRPFLIAAQGRPIGFETVATEILLLPLRHHGLTHARLLGCCAPCAAPAWLGLAPLAGLELLSMRALQSSENDVSVSNEGAPIFPKVGKSTAIDRRRHLYVFTQND